MIKFVDIIQDLAYGDAGKGAVAYSLSKKPEYDICMRVNGGSNAGHTIYHNGKKFVTHQVPTGIFHGKICIIGNGCVVNVSKLLDEIKELEAAGISCKGNIFIAHNAHIVMQDHIDEEANETAIGTTKQGIGPCYRDKYARIGMRAMDLLYEHNVKNKETGEVTQKLICSKKYGELRDHVSEMIIEVHPYFYNRVEEYGILVEGAQGYYLDIDHGDYPYVSSSHASVAGALLNGLPFNKIRKVYGVIKGYETYVGARAFQGKDPIFDKLGDLGQEFGATTGRRRQCNWLDLDRLVKAMQVNCVTHLIVSKMDILRELNFQENNKYWKFLSGTIELPVMNEEDFYMVIENQILFHHPFNLKNIQYKYGPDQEITV